MTELITDDFSSLEAATHCLEINHKLKQITVSDHFFKSEDSPPRGLEAYQKIIQEHLANLSEALQARLQEEYFGMGPFKNLLQDPLITEIILRRFDSIWMERQGKLEPSFDAFLSESTYHQFLQRLYLDIGQEPTLTHPFIDSNWKGHRLHIIGSYDSTYSQVRLTLRKHPQLGQHQWTLEKLHQLQWAKASEIQFLRQLIRDRNNFLVLGTTGAGKTSVLQALLQETDSYDRTLILEESAELIPPNEVSEHLLTRHDSRNILSPIYLSDLVRQSLRLRPDRIVVGEVRGNEATDLLMALATGHAGSAGTLHASNAWQALLRLEMLIQMGAPQWNLVAIRRLIYLSLQYLIVCTRQSNGHRSLEGIYKLVSVENSGITIERVLL